MLTLVLLGQIKYTEYVQCQVSFNLNKHDIKSDTDPNYFSS